MKTDKPRGERFDSNPLYKLALIFNKCKLVGKCFEWQGNYFYRKQDKAKTYPYMYYKNKVWRGNRLVWFLKHGVLPNDLFVLHKCDNTKCVNPDHLYLGTYLQNNRDIVDRGRHKEQKKTHCIRGHKFSKENTKIIVGRSGNEIRSCRACNKIYRTKEYKNEIR